MKSIGDKLKIVYLGPNPLKMTKLFLTSGVNNVACDV
jgi:hypothetical protein